MNLEELVLDLTQVPLDETRKRTGDYFEVVVTVDSLDSIEYTLRKYFGAPKKAEGKWPDREAKYLTQEHGGIRGAQTLYYTADKNDAYLAMIWPWSDGMLATVKIVKTVPKPPLPPQKSLWSRMVQGVSGQS